MQLADLQMNRKLAARAIDALHEALRLQPDADDQRLRLAQLLADHGAATDAAAHYLELARRSQARGSLNRRRNWRKWRYAVNPITAKSKN